MQPETEYAASGGLNIAYQVVGEGPCDLVHVPGYQHIEMIWECPASAAAFRRVGSIGRLILFDKRGTGLSDPVPLTALPTLEEWMDDVRAVVDAAGSDRAAIMAFFRGWTDGDALRSNTPRENVVPDPDQYICPIDSSRGVFVRVSG